jgi:hypothetical protein
MTNDKRAIVSSAHLADGAAPTLSELEFSSTLAAAAYQRWIVRCAAAAGLALAPLEVLILHTVRHRDRAKRIADIALVLDVEDTHLITYAIRKLERAGSSPPIGPARKSGSRRPRRAAISAATIATSANACWPAPSSPMVRTARRCRRRRTCCARCRARRTRRREPPRRFSEEAAAMLVLSGIAIIIIGFALGREPLAGGDRRRAGQCGGGGFGPVAVIAMIGRAFVDARFLAVPFLALPMIGLWSARGCAKSARHRAGLRRGDDRAGAARLSRIASDHGGAGAGVAGRACPDGPADRRPHGREGGGARRAPAARPRHARPDPRARRRSSYIGVFFGEDVFIAIGSILLIRAILEQDGVAVAPLDVALWAIPTAVAAFLIHGARLLLLDRRLRRRA